MFPIRSLHLECPFGLSASVRGSLDQRSPTLSKFSSIIAKLIIILNLTM
jgi:hypothetical protein